MSKLVPLLVSVAVVLLVMPSVASAAPLRSGDEGEAVEVLQRALDLRADGEFGPGTERAVRRFQRREDMRVDGVASMAVQRRLGIADDVADAQGDGEDGTSGSGGTEAGRPSGSEDESESGGGSVPAVLQRIAQCESGGDPTAVSSNGRYRGKYQFLRSTWESIGGSGDPAQASEAEQDRLATALYRREGTRPWPHCGRRATAARSRART